LIKDCIDKDQTIPEDDLYTVMVEMLLGLQHLHRNGIIHKDLKPQNVLIDENGKIRISDYASSRIFNNYEEYPYPVTITYYYMSPEMITGEKYGIKTDIWSIGCIMHELACFEVILLFIYSLFITVKHYNNKLNSSPKLNTIQT